MTFCLAQKVRRTEILRTVGHFIAGGISNWRVLRRDSGFWARIRMPCDEPGFQEQEKKTADACLADI